VNVSRLQIVFFGIALAALVASLRFILGTHLGIFGAVLAIVIGLLSLLYRAALSIALVLWDVSGALAHHIEGTYRRRMAVKESSHATRFL
jgi:hypothetical protein